MYYDRNDFKISFNEEPVFFVNEKKGTVTCRLRGCVVAPFDWARPTINSFVCEEVATAKCSPNDTFDVNRGKRIALSKAENRVYLSVLRELEKQGENFKFILDAIGKFSEKAYRCCAHNEDYIESLSYPAHPNYIENVNPPKRGEER